MGVLVLATALLIRSHAARNIGLVLIVLCAASAWPVLYFGQHGYSVHARQVLAFFGAMFASLSAMLAMLDVVTAAFFAAGAADFGADPDQVRGEF
jgi:hypothetical protein